MKKTKNKIGIQQSIEAIFSDKHYFNLASLQIKEDGKLKLVINKKLLEENEIELEEE